MRFSSSLLIISLSWISTKYYRWRFEEKSFLSFRVGWRFATIDSVSVLRLDMASPFYL
jgi:hypothetical protein